jgi:hypothetical protein
VQRLAAAFGSLYSILILSHSVGLCQFNDCKPCNLAILYYLEVCGGGASDAHDAH